MGLGMMLRIHFLQQWFNLSDPAAEEALYDSPVLRRFAGVDLGRAPAPDETMICKFRHLLERHDLGGAMLDAVNRHLESRGIRIATGTIVDATIIHAPSSTKNAKGERDPEMHQTRKGNQWVQVGLWPIRTELGFQPSGSRRQAESRLATDCRPTKSYRSPRCGEATLLRIGRSISTGRWLCSPNLLDEQRHFPLDQVRPLELDIVRASPRDHAPAVRRKMLQALLHALPRLRLGGRLVVGQRFRWVAGEDQHRQIAIRAVVHRLLARLVKVQHLADARIDVRIAEIRILQPLRLRGKSPQAPRTRTQPARHTQRHHGLDHE
jgi:hypothetical protein